MTEIRHCNKHGDTEFVYRESGKRWRCKKCAVEAVQRRRDLLKLKAIEYKGGCCCICGYKKYAGALEFHHLDSSKKNFEISSKGYTRSWDKVKDELDKCILVCSNCHKEIHSGVTQIPDGNKN